MVFAMRNASCTFCPFGGTSHKIKTRKISQWLSLCSNIKQKPQGIFERNRRRKCLRFFVSWLWRIINQWKPAMLNCPGFPCNLFSEIMSGNSVFVYEGYATEMVWRLWYNQTCQEDGRRSTFGKEPYVWLWNPRNRLDDYGVNQMG